MARKEPDRADRAEPQRHSGLLNKTGMAVTMGAVGLALVVTARFLAPSFVPLALLLMAVGVASAFLTVGRTYAGACPHCRRRIVYKHAYGAHAFRCRSCRGRVTLRRQGDHLFFGKG